MATVINKGKGKGKPPSMGQTKNNLSHPISDGNAPKTVPIQFKITEEEYQIFCELAGREIGFKKGFKSKMFQQMIRTHETM